MKTCHWRAADGTQLTQLIWEPQGNLIGSLAILHGMGAVAGEFAPVGEYLSARGWRVLAPNQRCNGCDPVAERRGHGFYYRDFRADIFLYWQQLAETYGAEFTENPVFLMGESLGAMLAANYVADEVLQPPPAGLVLCAPVVELAHPNPPWMRNVVRLLASAFPKLVINPAWFIQGKDSAVPLTRDKDYQAYVENAPHRIPAFTIQYTDAVAQMMERTQAIARKIQTPVLLLNGGADVFIRPEQSARWFEKIGSRDKTHIVFPEAMHLLFHELNTGEVLETLESWLLAHIARAEI